MAQCVFVSLVVIECPDMHLNSIYSPLRQQTDKTEVQCLLNSVFILFIGNGTHRSPCAGSRRTRRYQFICARTNDNV